jgi:uncharacterized protein
VKIRFSEILDEGLRLDIKDESWFPDEEIRRDGPVTAEVFLEKKGAGLVIMEGRLETVVILQCDRCLKEFKWVLNDTFAIDLEVVPDWGKEAVEHVCGAAEMDTLQLTVPEIDMYQLLRQQVLLMIPEKRICSETCPGLCPHCGADLNVTSCACGDRQPVSPFSVLGSLKQ